MAKWIVRGTVKFVSSFTRTVEADDEETACQRAAEWARDVSPDHEDLCPERVECDPETDIADARRTKA